MCSLQEAWNDFSLTNSANPQNDKMKQVREQQMAMDLQRNQQHMNSARQDMDLQMAQKPQQFDRVPEKGYYTQSDDRRQFAQPSADVFRPNYEREYLAKPPSGNSHGDTIRGVHNKFTREKRIPMMKGGNEHVNLTSNVQQPGELATTLNDVPKFVREFGTVEGKPYREGPSNGPAMPDNGPNAEVYGNGPIASNSDEVGEAFVSVDTDYFGNSALGLAPQPEYQVSQYQHQQQTSIPVPNSKPQTVPHTTNVPASLSQSNNTSSQSNKDTNMEQIKILKKQIQELNSKITTLETKLEAVENNRPHDIILIIVIALFILFIVDNVFKLKLKF
jgi:hypothetical protein